MRRPSQESGFPLVETLVALLALGLAVGAILSVASTAERGMALTREGVQARAYAAEVYEDNAAIASLASDDGEGERRHRRDDASSWTPIDDAPEWERSVTARRVDPARPEREASRDGSNLLEVTVSVRHRGAVVHSLRFLRYVE